MAENDDIPDGYPDSPPDELQAPGAPLSLDAADRELESEDLVEPTGAHPAGTADEDDALFDAPDADVLAALELGNAGSRPPDRANFEDNAAEWSRERE